MYLQAVNADVWRVSPLHVDVYFPTSDNYLTSLFYAAKLPHNSTGIPQSSVTTPSEQRPPKSSWNLTSLSNTTFHSVYHPLYEIEEFMEEMAKLYPDLVQLVNLGHSAEGREMIAMKLSKKPEGNNVLDPSIKTKTGFIVTGAQHAREVCRRFREVDQDLLTMRLVCVYSSGQPLLRLCT